jgi:hypothetical protein
MSSTYLLAHDLMNGQSQIRTRETASPVQVPPGHIGPVQLPGTGRMVWWTGRVAIGLRHHPTRSFGTVAQSALWVQDLLLSSGRGEFADA